MALLLHHIDVVPLSVSRLLMVRVRRGGLMMGLRVLCEGREVSGSEDASGEGGREERKKVE